MCSFPDSTEAGSVFLLHGAVSAGAPTLPNPAGLPEGPGAPAAPRGAEPCAEDGAGVRQARRAGRAAAGRPGEESHGNQKLGRCGGKCNRWGMYIWVCF